MPKLPQPVFLANWRVSRSTRVLLLLGCIYLGINLCQLLFQEVRLLNQGRILETELHASREKGQDFQHDIAYAHTPEGLERLARKNLGMARPGEMSVRFLQAPDGRSKI